MPTPVLETPVGILVAERPGVSHRNNVQLGAFGRNRSNLWRYAGATGGHKAEQDDFELHPTVKPAHLVRDAILDVTALGDVVLDPFLGSGTTILAAELSRRICVGLELSPIYVDVAVRRWERMTGRPALHAVTGQTFSEISEERGAGACSQAGSARNDTVPRNGSRYEDF